MFHTLKLQAIDEGKVTDVVQHLPFSPHAFGLKYLAKADNHRDSQKKTSFHLWPLPELSRVTGAMASEELPQETRPPADSQLSKDNLKAGLRASCDELRRQTIARQHLEAKLTALESQLPDSTEEKDGVRALLQDLAAQTSAKNKMEEQILKALDDLHLLPSANEALEVESEATLKQPAANEGMVAANPEARYDLTDPEALARFLQDSDVRLVRAKYMVQLARSKRPLPRRQEAESQQFTSDGKTHSALVSHDEIRSWAAGTQNAIICSISHAWETREHPDPCRYQLQQIVEWAVLYEAAFQADVWIFFDYMSLFQYERDPNSEQSSFDKAMANMHILYAHEFSLTFRIETLTPDEVWEAMNQNEQDLVTVWDDQSKSLKAKPLNQLMHNRVFYLERGWCKAEVEWSSLRTVNAQHQRIDQRDATGSDCDAFNGRVPMIPQAFRETMNRAEFTHRSDKDAVIHLQEKIFFEKVTSCETLVLEGLPATQLEALARALPLYENLKHLTINKFRCGEREAQLFAEALAKTTVLEKIEVRNGEGESGKHLIKACPENSKRINQASSGRLEWADIPTQRA
eukprot:s287_g36.t1